VSAAKASSHVTAVVGSIETRVLSGIEQTFRITSRDQYANNQLYYPSRVRHSTHQEPHTEFTASFFQLRGLTCQEPHVEYTLILGIPVGKLYSASTLTIYFKGFLQLGWEAHRRPPQLNPY
jgi:hypothetical protein